MVRKVPRTILLLFLLALSGPLPASAQDAPTCDPLVALNLAISDVGVGLGDTERTTGVRVNYGDTCLQTANGINATLSPPFSAAGTVNGLALGLPLTGSARLRGLAVGVGLFFGNAGTVRGSTNGLLLGGIATVSESPARGVLVGDGPQDVGAAWNAGLDAVHVERHGHDRRGLCVLGDHRVDGLDELRP